MSDSKPYSDDHQTLGNQLRNYSVSKGYVPKSLKKKDKKKYVPVPIID